jgi:hypothetical protein
VDQRVLGSVRLLMANKMDMRFFCLPYLQKNAVHYSPIDQVLKYDEGEPHNSFNMFQIFNWKTLNLNEICDINDKFDDLILCKYNEDKVMNWLKKKVLKTSISVSNQKKLLSKQPKLYANNFVAVSSSSQSSDRTDSLDGKT